MSGRCGRPSARPWCRSAIPAPRPTLSASSAPKAGQGRWVDPRNWVYDFTRDLPAGVRCSFQLKAGLRSLAGKELAGPREFVLFHRRAGHSPLHSLRRPKRDQRGPGVHPCAGRRAERGDGGLPGRGSPLPASSSARGRGSSPATTARRFSTPTAGSSKTAPTAARSCSCSAASAFPQKAPVSLVWGKGIASASGVATEQDQTISFETREHFSAEFSCERENARSGCIPVLSMSLSFNAPLSRNRRAKPY